MHRIVQHIRGNAIAYVALFVALGGTSYAALSLPAASVGARQLKNHSIDPVKLNPKFITGSVRAWAIVASDGRIVAGGGGPTTGPSPTVGSHKINWKQQFAPNCSTLATVDANHSPTTERLPVPGNPSLAVTAGYAVADSSRGAAGRGVTFVSTFNQSGQLTPLGFDVAVVC